MTHESSWEQLAEQLDSIKITQPLWAQWHAYVGSEDYGIWILRPDGPSADQARAKFSLFAAQAIQKLGILPIPVPERLQHCPHWTEYCRAEEGMARRAGQERDLSDAVPYGLDKIDWDAVDPCTRAWLELLRRESRDFRVPTKGTETFRGAEYQGLSSRIEDLCGASAAYCNRRARDEIGAQLGGRLEAEQERRMKRDWDLMRKIALAVEDTPIGTVQRQPSIAGYGADEVGYHVHRLLEAGLARGNNVTNTGHTHPFALISDLTLAGHEVAELARDETRWGVAMAEARSTGPITLTALIRFLTTPQPQAKATDQAAKPQTENKPSDEPQTEGGRSGGRINRPNPQETRPGSMDRVSMTDPIWDFGGTQNVPIFITRLSGKVDRIDPSMENEPDDADLKPEEELRINEVTTSGRSALRNEIETAFSGSEWPPPRAIIPALRRYAVNVFDVNAAAYREAISVQRRDAKVALSAMVRNLLAGLFGREWENSPGERVVRIRWQDGTDGWKGEEIAVIAGNDPDPTCLYHQVVGDAIKHRYRFHSPLPPQVPGEPPGLGVSNLEWWQYIGLQERHDLAMVVRPYLEDRIAHWQVVYATPQSNMAANAPTKVPRTSPESVAEQPNPNETQFDAAVAAKQARASTVAKLIKELDGLKPQMFEDDAEYERLRAQYTSFLTFKIADGRPDLKMKVLAIRSSTRHIRLAQELAAAHHGRQFATIQDDWKDHKPAEFRRPG